MIWFILFIIAVAIILVQQVFITLILDSQKMAVQVMVCGKGIIKLMNKDGFSWGDKAMDALEMALVSVDPEDWQKAYEEFLICDKELKEDA